MSRMNHQRRGWVRLTAIGWLASMVACSSSGSSGGDTGKGLDNAACQGDSDCASGVCTDGACSGNGRLAPSGAACTENAECASQHCARGVCGTGAGLADDMSCSTSGECESGVCTQGVCGTSGPSGVGGATGTGATGSGATGVGGTGTLGTNPPFAGLGTTYRPLTPGCGPDTARQCAGTCESTGGDPTATVIRPPALLCFVADPASGLEDPTPADPAAIIEQVVETLNGVSYVHIRVTFDPAFVDNTYGANASAGWFQTANGKTGDGHTFSTDLTNSDHIELLLTDGAGNTVLEVAEDYIHSLTTTTKPKPGETGTGGTASDLPPSDCGYSNLGLLGDGEMMLGDASAVLGFASSIDRNLNGCGYCQSDACSGDTSPGDCTVNSPATDENYTPNPATPEWNYDVVYEVWLSLDAFGSAGFGQAYVSFVHASPSKIGQNTLIVIPGDCPPTWGICPPGSANCWGSGGEGGTGGEAGSGNTGVGGGTGSCPINYQLYVASEGAATCTPVPFANYPGMTACPAGYVLDTASEGQYCLPSGA